ncbi:MAG TPA: hypothetical protein PKE00_08420 [Planctomycetota bacterium]|nr:hypothetical protein [Planctomycetota bacterium]
MLRRFERAYYARLIADIDTPQRPRDGDLFSSRTKRDIPRVLLRNPSNDDPAVHIDHHSIRRKQADTNVATIAIERNTCGRTHRKIDDSIYWTYIQLPNADLRISRRGNESLVVGKLQGVERLLVAEQALQ